MLNVKNILKLKMDVIINCLWSCRYMIYNGKKDVTIN